MIKAQPMTSTPNGYQNCTPEEATHVMLNVPGPIPTRVIPVMTKGTRAGTGNWTWNGSIEAPTLRPSVLTTFEPYQRPKVVCHSWINDGNVQFLNDCTHAFSGQTLELLEVDR